MRIAFFGLLTATAVIATACSPAVGSPEWCKQFQAKHENNPNPLEVLSNLTPEERAAWLTRIAGARSGLFLPLSEVETIAVPGGVGGTNWGNTATFRCFINNSNEAK